MINNRQGGRRRGRGGQRPQGMTGNGGNNARDNRQRGNAAQLLEKYKNMARDAQLAGDRVQTEYFLQFADHYFRVLEETRSRYEDQQPQRRRRDEDDFDGDDEDMVADGGEEEAEAEAEAEPDVRQQQRQRREPRGPRERFRDRDDQPRANGAGRSEESESHDERIPLGVLPPAIGADSGDSSESDETPRPRRRARKPRDQEGDGSEAA